MTPAHLIKPFTWLSQEGIHRISGKLSQTAGLVATIVLLSPNTQAQAQAVRQLTIVSVTANNDSVKVLFEPVLNAGDYRIYNMATPSHVKYAGIAHLFTAPYSNTHFVMSAHGTPLYPYQTSSSGSGPVQLDIPDNEIEMNGLTPGQPVTLVVEAVDCLGPASAGNLYDSNNAPLCPTMQDTTSMLGSDSGKTPMDGNSTINGQGPYTNAPNVIARSRPFVVTPTGTPSLPSGSDATQVFFEPFANNIATFNLTTNPGASTMTGTLTTAANSWDVIGQNIDTLDTTPFVMGDHLMEVLFDAGTPGTNNPLHQGHGVLNYSPKQTFDFSNGQILHATFEVDGHTDGRRWIGMSFVPANDPLTGFDQFTDQLNQSDQALFFAVAGGPTLDVFTGPTSSTNPLPTGYRQLGALGQGIRWGQRPLINYKYGRGIDDRSRFDLFISQTHYAWYEDGVEVDEADFSQPLPFSTAKAYFSHYLYHTDNEINDCKNNTPYETFWINIAPYSDERHWDNLGLEVIPAGTNWATLPSRLHLPQPHSPKYIQ